MQRHAEGCGDLWNKQTTYGSDTTTASSSSPNTFVRLPSTSAVGGEQRPSSSNSGSVGTVAGTSMACDTKKKATIRAKPNDWVVIPVFADIVRLAITARDDCHKK